MAFVPMRRAVQSLGEICVIGRLSTSAARNEGIKIKSKQSLRYQSTFRFHNIRSYSNKWSLLLAAVAAPSCYVMWKWHSNNSRICCLESVAACSSNESIHPDRVTQNKLRERDLSPLKLYQYQTCPFCGKVRAFLDYYGIDYEKIEVNPLRKKELKFSKSYRKVPILVLGDETQLNDSSFIVSILYSYMFGKQSIEKLMTYYPVLEFDDEKGKKKTEIQNRNRVMYEEPALSDAAAKAIKEEVHWRKWVDSTFVHMLSPNIYRTMSESFLAFDYITEVGNFGRFETLAAKYFGAVFMYGIGKRIKSRHNLKDDVRQSLYDEANKWTKAIGKKRLFLGGNNPNLADLSMYGVLSGIDGLPAFKDLLHNTDIGPWYHRMKKAVQSHAGASRIKPL